MLRSYGSQAPLANSQPTNNSFSQRKPNKALHRHIRILSNSRERADTSSRWGDLKIGLIRPSDEDIRRIHSEVSTSTRACQHQPSPARWFGWGWHMGPVHGASWDREEIWRMMNAGLVFFNGKINWTPSERSKKGPFHTLKKQFLSMVIH
jgi:hypothetical protein